MPDAPGSGGLVRPYSAPAWDLGRLRVQPQGRPLVMGIVNLTPDSFYPGSRGQDPQAAVALALRLVAEGADLLDLGAESSRPGAAPVGSAQEQDRLLPVLAALRQETTLPISVDTVRADTARAALQAGADALNDISAGTLDPEMLPLAAARGCGLILMHMQGTPSTMQKAPHYSDVVVEVRETLSVRAAAAERAGVARACLMVDPGIGFGKTMTHNMLILNHLHQISGGLPLLVGVSRKRFIGEICGAIWGAEVDDRLPGSLAALAAAFLSGATMVRVHDVAASVQYLEVLRAVAAADGF